MDLLNVGDKIYNENYYGITLYEILRVTEKFAIVHINNGANDGKGYDMKFKRQHTNGIVIAAGDTGPWKTYYSLVTAENVGEINYKIRIQKLSNVKWEKLSKETIKQVYDIIKESKQ